MDLGKPLAPPNPEQRLLEQFEVHGYRIVSTTPDGLGWRFDPQPWWRRWLGRG